MTTDKPWTVPGREAAAQLMEIFGRKRGATPEAIERAVARIRAGEVDDQDSTEASIRGAMFGYIQGLKDAREAVKSHRGKAEVARQKRRQHGMRIAPEAWPEIAAEERGENIASDIIAEDLARRIVKVEAEADDHE